MHHDVPSLSFPQTGFLFLRDGYAFISKQCAQFHSDLFRGYAIGERAYFMTGADAAELFYDETRFQRAGAVPKFILQTLFGEGGVQGLDDADHRDRKAMFMSLMTKSNIARFLELAETEWEDATKQWEQRERVVLFDEAELVFCRAACAWAGLSLTDEETERLARDCGAMVSGFASFSPAILRARAARLRGEAWARGVIEAIRRRELQVEEGRAARVFAEHRDRTGTPLPLQVAAVELLNIIRPITALARWVAWIGLALRDYPAEAAKLRSSGDERDAQLDAFVQEVRRFYPFTPLLGARARTRFEWRGVKFEPGQLAVLDVYGTLRDARIWDRPEAFMPERFIGREPGAFEFIPHGGGEFLGGHRCAGEWLAIEALKQTTRVLTSELRYELPAQDLSYSLTEIVTRPRSGVILRNVFRDPHASARAETPDVRQLRGGDEASMPA